MPNYYQYETSPRKYEPEYKTKKTNKTNKKNTETKRVSKKESEIQKLEKQRAKRKEERKSKSLQLVIVVAIFGMLLAISYREIAIMEMFNQKKELENNLATIQKENGQVEKSIKEVESELDWNKIKQVAAEELGMQAKAGIAVNLEKSDNIETETKLIKEEKTSLFEKIVSFLIEKIEN